MVSAFSDSLIAPGGVKTPPEISKTEKDMTIKFSLDFVTYMEVQNQQKFDIDGPVCKLQTKILKEPIFGNASSRHANFTRFCRTITIDVRNKH